MKYILSKKMIKFFHTVRISFERIFIVTVVIFLGSALLSIYSLIDFVKRIFSFARNNFNTSIIILTILISIPLVSYILEKGLDLYFTENKKQA